MIDPNPHLKAIAPYSLADLSVPAGVKPIMLAQNEAPFPPSPKAIEALSKAASTANFYPEAGYLGLRTALAEQHGLDRAAIMCGAGSMELIAALCHAYLGPDDWVLTTAYSYLYFTTAARLAGATVEKVPEVNLTVDVAALISNATSAATPPKMVFVANPGNPTGTRIDRDAILALRRALPEQSLLVIDEAYGEFADHLGERHFDLVDQGNVLVLRTFSKAYAMAGLRVGWGVFPKPMTVELNKVLVPDTVNHVAQAAAIAALGDRDYLAFVLNETASNRDHFIAQCQKAGIDAQPSITNFTLIRFDDAGAAQACIRHLRAHGLLVRAMGGYGLPNYVRISIGDAAAMDRCLTLLRDPAASVAIS